MGHGPWVMAEAAVLPRLWQKPREPRRPSKSVHWRHGTQRWRKLWRQAVGASGGGRAAGRVGRWCWQVVLAGRVGRPWQPRRPKGLLFPVPRLQTADCRLQTADCRLQTAEPGLHHLVDGRPLLLLGNDPSAFPGREFPLSEGRSSGKSRGPHGFCHQSPQLWHRFHHGSCRQGCHGSPTALPRLCHGSATARRHG